MDSKAITAIAGALALSNHPTDTEGLFPGFGWDTATAPPKRKRSKKEKQKRKRAKASRKRNRK